MKRILLICAFLLALAVQAGAQSKQQQQQPVEVNGLVVDSEALLGEWRSQKE